MPVKKGKNGNDRLVGQQEKDTLKGMGGNDTLIGKAGKDILQGGSGDDLLQGGGGRDTLNGGAGNDTLKGGGGIDTLKSNGNGGNDQTVTFTADKVGTISIEGGGEATFRNIEKVKLGSGDDTVNFSTFGNNHVLGQNGNDTFIFADGYLGPNTIKGGEGTDSIEIQDTGPQQVIIHSNTSADITEDLNLDDIFSVDELQITFSDIEEITLFHGNDAIHLYEGANNMTLDGGDGDDSFNFNGNDNGDNLVLIGGPSFDTLVVNNGDNDDLVFNLTAEGGGTFTDDGHEVTFSSIETIRKSAGDTTVNISSGVGNINLSFFSSHYNLVNLDGNDIGGFIIMGFDNGNGHLVVDDEDADGLVFTIDNSLSGSFSENGTLNELEFSNLGDITSGAGDDTFVFEEDYADMTLSGAGGYDTLDFSELETESITINADLDVAIQSNGNTITFSHMEIFIGTPLNDAITGGAFAEHLVGGEGNDFLSGGKGADTLNGGSGSDSMYGGLGNDFYQVLELPEGDIIEDSGGFDILSFDLDDPGFEQIGNDLIIEELLTITNYFNGVGVAGTGCIEIIAFDNLTILYNFDTIVAAV